MNEKPQSPMTRYTRSVLRHRAIVLAGIAVVTVLLGKGLTGLRVEVEADRQLPQDHPFIQALNQVHDVFGDKNLVIVGLVPHDGDVFTPHFLHKLAEVTNNLRRIPGANPALVQSLAAPQIKDIRGSEDGMIVERVMETPPDDAEGAEAVRKRAFANPAYIGTLVASDASMAAVHATFELTPEIPGYRHLHTAVVKAIEAADDGSFDVHLSGPVIFLSNATAYASRILYFFPLALVVIGLVHYHGFRTLQAIFLPLLTAILSVIWALGLTGLSGVPLDAFNTTTPILILAVAAGHAVQVMKRFYESYAELGDVDAAIVASMSSVGPVMLAAGMVAGLAFFSLSTLGTATMRTFGLIAGFGIFSALAIELTLIPALRSYLPAPPTREREREAAAHPWLDGLLAMSARATSASGARYVLASAVILIVVCLALAARIQVETSLKRQFSSTSRILTDDTLMNEKLAGTNTLLVLVEGNEEGALEEPSVMRAIDRLERRLEAEPGVGGAVSYVDFLRKMHQAMNGDRPPTADDLPDSRRLAAQYLFLHSLSGGDGDFSGILDPTYRLAKIRVLVHEDSTKFGVALINKVQHWVAETFPPTVRVRVTGSLALTAAVTETMVHGKLRNIGQIALMTFLIAALLLRSWIGGLLVVLPLAFTVAVNFGVMGLLGIRMDLWMAMISAMAVGIGADYAMYFLNRVREELARGGDISVCLRRALLTSGKAVLFVSSAIACGYTMLCFSGYQLHVQLGGLVSLAMMVSSVSTLVLLPAAIVKLRPAFLLRDAREPFRTRHPEEMVAA